MQKTISEWLGVLPEPHKSLAYSNANSSVLELHVESADEAIKCAFIWAETKEGHEFWAQVCNHLSNPLPWVS